MSNNKKPKRVQLTQNGYQSLCIDKLWEDRLYLKRTSPDENTDDSHKLYSYEVLLTDGGGSKIRAAVSFSISRSIQCGVLKKGFIISLKRDQVSYQRVENHLSKEYLLIKEFEYVDFISFKEEVSFLPFNEPLVSSGYFLHPYTNSLDLEVYDFPHNPFYPFEGLDSSGKVFQVLAKSSIHHFGSKKHSHAFPFYFQLIGCPLDDHENRFTISIWNRLVIQYYFDVFVGDVIEIRKFKKKTHEFKLEYSLNQSCPKGEIRKLRLENTYIDWYNPILLNQINYRSMSMIDVIGKVSFVGSIKRYFDQGKKCFNMFRWITLYNSKGGKHILVKLYKGSLEKNFDNLQIWSILLLTELNIIVDEVTASYFFSSTKFSEVLEFDDYSDDAAYEPYLKMSKKVQSLENENLNNVSFEGYSIGLGVESMIRWCSPSSMITFTHVLSLKDNISLYESFRVLFLCKISSINIHSLGQTSFFACEITLSHINQELDQTLNVKIEEAVESYLGFGGNGSMGCKVTVNDCSAASSLGVVLQDKFCSSNEWRNIWRSNDVRKIEGSLFHLLNKKSWIACVDLYRPEYSFIELDLLCLFEDSEPVTLIA